MAYCSHCGAYVSDDSRVCGSCGAPLQTAPQSYTPPSYTPPPYSPYGNPPVTRMGGGFRANIQKRDAGMGILLSIVTCGIYALIWFFWIVNDLNTADPRPDDKDPATVLLLSIVTCGIFGIIWLYNAGQKVDNIRQRNGEAPSGSSTTYLVLSLFGLGIIVYYLIQTELNKVAIDA